MAKKIIIFMITGILFELIYLLFKLEIKNIQADIILGTALSSALIPLLIGTFVSLKVTASMISSILNLVLLSFFIGVVGSILSFMVWYNLKHTETILRYEYNSVL